MSRQRASMVLTVGVVLAGASAFAGQFLVSGGSSVASRWERGMTGVLTLVGVLLAVVGGVLWWRSRGEVLPPRSRPDESGSEGSSPRRPLTPQMLGRVVWPWAMAGSVLLLIVLVGAAVFDVPAGRMWDELRYLVKQAWSPTESTDTRDVVWKSPRAIVLALGAVFVAVIAFHLQRRRSAALGFSQVKLVGTRGFAALVVDLPAVLRVVAVFALAVALARPETYRTLKREVDSIDIVIVFDMSKSMEETDMPRDRMDAAQRVVRRFLRRNKNDRIGLVIFGQQAMLQCPLTHDSKMLEKIIADLVIGDVPELGTAIGDGLALGIAQLRRSDAKSKVIILLSDGDSNWVTRFDPDEAARVAQEQKIKVYTLLVGREESDLFGGMSVNPATLRNIAQRTGGEFFRASDYAAFDRGFQTVRTKLDTTKRTVTERIPDKQLFVPFAILAALLIGLELLLSYTRLRRLP